MAQAIETPPNRGILDAFLRPATALMGRLRLVWKLTLLLCLMLVPLVFVTWQYTAEQASKISFSAKERVGSAYVAPAAGLLGALVAARSDAVAAALDGHAADPAKDVLETQISAVDAVEARYGATLGTTEQWRSLKADIGSLPSGSGLDPKEIFDAYSQATASAMALVTQAGNESNLILDPDLDSFYVMNAAVVSEPTMVDAVGQAVDLATLVAAGRNLGQDELAKYRVDIALAKGAAQAQVTANDTGLRTSFGTTADAQLEPALSPRLSAMDDAMTKVFGSLDPIISASSRGDVSELRSAGSAAVESASAFGAATVPSLDALLDARIGGFSSSRNLVLAIAAVVGAVALYLFAGAIRGVVRSARRIETAVQAAALGDTETRAGTGTRDEFGSIAAMLDEQLSPSQREIAALARRVAAGDVSERPMVRSDSDVLGESVDGVVTTLRSLMEEVGSLVAAAKAGDLGYRGADSAYEGAYRDLVAGINEALEAMAAPIEESRVVLAAVSRRDLTRRMLGDYRGAFGEICDAMNSAVSGMDEGFGVVASSASQVSAASRQITEGSDELARAATSSAATLEEILAQLSQLKATAEANAEDAAEARSVAGQTDDAVGRGTEAMSSLSAAMVRIKERADATSRIVRTIDEIAFQTNLLALNAAVEAARAGDAGKGFAVVAEEVRSLAMRSAEAAHDTAQLIEDSVQQVGEGVAHTDSVQENLDAIAGHISHIAGMMQQLSETSHDQAGGVAQVTTAVDQLSRISQDTAAHSEEAAAGASELDAQAAELRNLTTGYRLSGNDPAVRTSVPV